MNRSQLELIGALAGLVLLVVLTSGLLVERALHRREKQGLEARLEQQARLVAELVREVPFEARFASRLDSLADRAGAAAGVRVTLIAPDGRVLGDSDVPEERLAGIENHAERPEVREALGGRVGQASRRSGTVGRPMHYLALPRDAPGGAIRVAVDLSDVESSAAGLRDDLLLAGAVGLLAAVFLSYGLVWFMTRPLRELRRLTAAVAAGDLERRLPRHLRDELGDIATAIQRLADQLWERLAETTAEKERLQAVLDGMVEGVLVVDRSSRVVLANDRLRNMLSAPEDLVGRPLLETIRHADLAETLERAAGRAEPVTCDLRVTHPLPRSLRVHAVRFPARAARPLGSVAVVHDVSELERIETMRRDFVANASHELRTPLAAIRGFAETLLGSGSLPEDKRRSYLEVIDRNARRLERLVGDLLELSRIESGKLTLRPEAVDLVELARSLLNDHRPRFEAREIAVSLEAAQPAVAWADPAAVEQILQNLLANALQYTDPGGRVSVEVAAAPGEVRLTVRDTGIGIPPRDIDRIFERFYRVDTARSRALGGTGLGLAIVKHLIKGLGGDIQVTSRPGEGSAFSLRLPSAPTQHRRDPGPPAALPPAAPSR
jgi:two-component system phosphate regulon sensor histidine kinase PhoR